jgi:hypothetical protein
LVSDQDTHFINDAIKILTNHFLFHTLNSTTYYPQGNGQVEFTDKVIRLQLSKLVNENHMDWDEHLHTILFTYMITLRVGIGHTPFQLVYGLHALMPTKYLLLMTNFTTFQDFSMT